MFLISDIYILLLLLLTFINSACMRMSPIRPSWTVNVRSLVSEKSGSLDVDTGVEALCSPQKHSLSGPGLKTAR